jgi:hypothetical protein
MSIVVLLVSVVCIRDGSSCTAIEYDIFIVITFQPSLAVAITVVLIGYWRALNPPRAPNQRRSIALFGNCSIRFRGSCG